MTLVIGKIIDGDITVLSDTKITDLQNNLKKPFTERIKSIIINENNCISYAGNYTRAEYDLREILKRGISKKDDLETFLIEKTFNYDDTSYLLTSCEENPIIIRVSEGRIEESKSSLWIGDAEAFNLFQQKYSTKKKQNPIEDLGDIPDKDIETLIELTNFTSAFSDIVRDEQAETVGDYMIGLGTKIRYRKGFKYHTSTCFVGGLIPPEIDLTTGEDISNPVDHGGLTYHILASIIPGKSQLGIYMEEAQLGVLYDLIKDFTPRIYSKVTELEFIEKARQEDIHISM